MITKEDRTQDMPRREVRRRRYIKTKEEKLGERRKKSKVRNIQAPGVKKKPRIMNSKRMEENIVKGL